VLLAATEWLGGARSNMALTRGRISDALQQPTAICTKTSTTAQWSGGAGAVRC